MFIIYPVWVRKLLFLWYNDFIVNFEKEPEKMNEEAKAVYAKIVELENHRNEQSVLLQDGDRSRDAEFHQMDMEIADLRDQFKQLIGAKE